MSPSSTSSDLAWAAGLFEGEGSVCITKYQSGKGTRKYLLLSLSMLDRDRDVLERFARIVGVGNVTGPYANGISRWGTGTKGRVLISNPEFTRHLGCRRLSRIAEVLAELDAQSPPLTPSEAGKRGGRPRKILV